MNFINFPPKIDMLCSNVEINSQAKEKLIYS